MYPNEWKSPGKIFTQSFETESKLFAITLNTVSNVWTLSTTGISPPPTSVLSIFVQFQLKKVINSKTEIPNVIFALNTGE